MAQSPPCSDIVTPGDPPEFELCGEPDPEGIRLYWGIDHPTETRGKRLRRGPSCDQLSGHRSHHWRPDYTGPIAKNTIDLDTTPGQTYCYQVHLLDASERVIGVSTTVSVTDTGAHRRAHSHTYRRPHAGANHCPDFQTPADFRLRPGQLRFRVWFQQPEIEPEVVPIADGHPLQRRRLCPLPLPLRPRRQRQPSSARRRSSRRQPQRRRPWSWAAPAIHPPPPRASAGPRPGS